LQSIVGVFINTLVLRSQPTGNKTFAGFLKEVREKALQAYETRNTPSRPGGTGKSHQGYQSEPDIRHHVYHAAILTSSGRNPRDQYPGIKITTMQAFLKAI